METKANNIAVGAFVLAGICALVIAVIWLGRGQFMNVYAYYQTAFTGSVTGLGQGTLVRYNGIDVGHVSKLEFDRNDPKRVIALLEVQPDVAIHEDSVAIVESEGLAGATYVEIEGGSPNSPLLEPKPGQHYPVIASKPSPFQQVKEVAPQLLNHLDAVADRASDVFNEENRQALAKTVSNLTVASERLTRVLAATDEAAKKVGHLSANADDLVSETKGEIKQSVARLNQTLESADDTAKRIGQLTADADDVIAASKAQIKQGTAQFAQLMAQSRVLVDSLTRLSNDIQRQPTELLFGDRREGYKPK